MKQFLNASPEIGNNGELKEKVSEGFVVALHPIGRDLFLYMMMKTISLYPLEDTLYKAVYRGHVEDQHIKEYLGFKGGPV